MNEIVWSDPPPRRSRSGSFAWFWQALTESPGRWAEYPGKATGGANLPKCKDGHYETTSRRVDGVLRRWCRWVPEDAA